MECRAGCGACCIAPSIREPLPGMPDGKPAGVRCVHLAEDLRCGLWGDSRRPAVCAGFRAEPEVCGADRDEALRLIGELEAATRPD
jgi:Fe-S-cluster containining protein